MNFSPFSYQQGRVQAAPNPLPIASGDLQLYYDFSNTTSYPGSGTVVTDLSGNGRTGTLVNGPTFSSTNGGVMVFDASNDYLDTTYTGVTSRPLSIGVWVYLTNLSMFRSFAGIDTSAAIDRGQFYFQKAGTTIFGMIDNYANFQFPYPGNNDINIVNNNITTAINTWYNFVAVISTTDMKFYRNGTLISTVGNTNPLLTPTGTMKIGTAYYANNLVDFLGGRIGDFYFYNRTLSDAEVLSNFNNTKTRYGL